MSTPTPRQPEPSIRTIASRLRAVEDRLADLEGPYAETMYRTHRKVTGIEITLARLAAEVVHPPLAPLFRRGQLRPRATDVP